MKILSIPILLASSFVLAQEDQNSEPVAELEALTIESSPLGTKTTDVTQAWSVLSGDDLDKARGQTIADTLSDTPGVSQTSFGPTANRPVIRGMDKFRIRVLQNGTDSFDVSAQSEDHALPIDPLMVDRIEVLRGSSALLYGGSAIGGVVNVIDRNIPTSLYDSPSASLLSSYSSVNEGLSYGAVSFGSSDKLSYQLNVSKRDYNDYDAPTFAPEDHHGGGNLPARDIVENSHSDSTNFGFGASYMLDSGYIGFSLSSNENDYGVPGEHAESDTLIEMESDRFEFRSEIEISDSDFLTGIDLNLGYGDYMHSESGNEAGPDGNMNTDDDEFHTHATYIRKGLEGRIGLDHEIGNLKGVIGVQGLIDLYKIVGEESIFAGASGSRPAISSEESTKMALYLVEEYNLTDKTSLNFGARWESYDRNYKGPDDRDDSTFSASGGVSHDLSELWNISGNLNYSERAPDTAELYSDGAHHATESYEIGNGNLDTESAVGVEIIVRKTVGKVTGQFSAFHTKFNDYIFLEESGQVRDTEGNLADLAGNDGTLGTEDDEFSSGAEGLPVKEYEGIDAEFQGIEVEVDWLAMENPGWDLLLSAYGDLIRGKNKTEGGNLARIPATRLGVGFEVQKEKLDFGMKLTRSLKQDRVAVHDDHSEDPTDAFSLLNAFASYDFNLGDSVGELFVKGYNLTDELAYNHASVLKQFAPLAGRSVEIGLKFDF